MSWNYRIMKRKVEFDTGDAEDFFAVHEVYYNKDGEIYGWTEKPVGVCGESLEEIKEALEYYKEAFHKEVLDWDELEASEKS